MSFNGVAHGMQHVRRGVYLSCNAFHISWVTIYLG